MELGGAEGADANKGTRRPIAVLRAGLPYKPLREKDGELYRNF